MPYNNAKLLPYENKRLDISKIENATEINIKGKENMENYRLQFEKHYNRTLNTPSE